MKPTNDTMLSFYRQIGKVFYGIAAADKVIRDEEIVALKEILKKEWLPLENTFDEFGTDSAFQIEFVFDWLVENEFDTTKILIDFENFENEHPSLFTERVKELIRKTADIIAESFHGTNKAENEYLNKLKFILARP